MSLVVILLRRVVTDHQRVLGQLFVETFLGRAVEVKVQGLGDLGQGAQCHEREECPHVFCRVVVWFGENEPRSIAREKDVMRATGRGGGKDRELAARKVVASSRASLKFWRAEVATVAKMLQGSQVPQSYHPCI